MPGPQDRARHPNALPPAAPSRATAAPRQQAPLPESPPVSIPEPRVPRLAGLRALVLDKDLARARTWVRVLAPHGVTARAFDDLRKVRRHVQRNANSLDVILFDILEIGGDPSDLLRIVTETPCACGLVLATQRPQRVACELAARLRVDTLIIPPITELTIVEALARTRTIVAARRNPRAAAVDPMHDPDDVAERILDRILDILARAGLVHPHGQQALRMRARGMTDEGAAVLAGVSVHRLRARVGDALRQIGADDGYAILGVLARQLADDLAAVASAHGLSVEAIRDQISEALLSAVFPDPRHALAG